MYVLACDCRSGTVTLGLANAIAPGIVTGIDKANSQICIAEENAKK